VMMITEKKMRLRETICSFTAATSAESLALPSSAG